MVSVLQKHLSVLFLTFTHETESLQEKKKNPHHHTDKEEKKGLQQQLSRSTCPDQEF